MLHNNNFGWFVVSGLNNLVNTMKGHVSSCHFLWSMKKISNKSLFCSFLTNKICIDCIQTVKKRHLTSCRLSNSYFIENVFKPGTSYQTRLLFFKNIYREKLLWAEEKKNQHCQLMYFYFTNFIVTSLHFSRHALTFQMT